MRYFRASDGAEIAFADQGSGSLALLFVHGWQADHSVWGDVIDALRPEMRAVAVDLRGSGRSSAAAGPYRLERFAADLRELVDALELGQVVVVGHSMGATVALRFALDAPQATRGLALIAPVPASGGGFSAKGEAYLRATAGDPAAAKRWLARTFAGTPDEARLNLVCAAAARTPSSVALESFESWAHADFAEETKRITAPALVIAPEHDVPEAHKRKVAALLPNARYVVLSECGHYAIVERPEELARSVRDFISAL
jgi:pimeloyl-ACP methyl ester carboxylesterase